MKIFFIYVLLVLKMNQTSNKINPENLSPMKKQLLKGFRTALEKRHTSNHSNPTDLEKQLSDISIYELFKPFNI
jgi:hypothetical protein